MKLLQILAAALLSVLLSAPALAQDTAAADKVKAELKKKLTDVQVDSVRKIAARFGLDPSTVQRISRPLNGTGVAA